MSICSFCNVAFESAAAKALHDCPAFVVSDPDTEEEEEEGSSEIDLGDSDELEEEEESGDDQEGDSDSDSAYVSDFSVKEI